MSSNTKKVEVKINFPFWFGLAAVLGVLKLMHLIILGWGWIIAIAFVPLWIALAVWLFAMAVVLLGVIAIGILALFGKKAKIKKRKLP